MNKIMYYFLSGILIGTCMILPGISGSIVAIMLGIYEELICLLNNNQNILMKIKKIFPMMIGIIIGIFIFGKILFLFYNKYSFYMMYVFIGLILGSVPVLTKEICEKGENLKYRYLITSFLISIIIFLFPKIFNFTLSNSDENIIILFLGGILYISGKVIPGISSSFFLMILGLYNYVLTLITNPFNMTLEKIKKIIPFILGALIGLYVFIKLLNYLLTNYFSKTYSVIIGFIIGSIFAIFPGIKFDIEGIISIFLMMLAYQIVKKMAK